MIGATSPAGLKPPSREALRRSRRSLGGGGTRLYERDSLFSSELQVALAPQASYQRFLSASSPGRWHVLHRLAVIVLVIAVMVPIMAVQRVTLGLVTTAALSWSFSVLLQSIVGVAIVVSAPARRIGVLPALDLWFTSRFAQWMAARSNGPIIIAGQEITNPSYHMIAVGIEHTVNADQPAKGAIADVHAQGGVAIAAHPTPKFNGYNDDATVAALDGTEAAHPADNVSNQQLFADFFERVRRLKPTIAPIGSSDFHVSPQLAGCRTFVFAREASAAGVVDAIRGGRTIAVDENGRLYGDPRLIELLGPTPLAERRDGNGGWRRLSVALAWIGLLGMLVFA